jgi:CRISPR-associated protein Csx10
MLYSLEVLNESQGKAKRQPTIYSSSILIDDDTLADGLYNFIDQNHNCFRLGGSASRGLGQVEISVDQEDASVSTQAVKDRLNAFNQCLGQRWQQWAIFGMGAKPIEGRTFFAIGLESEAILVENWRRTFVLSAEVLRQLVKLDQSEVRLEMAYSSYGYRSGWNAAWGLAKDVELVTAMGSVFLFSIPTPEQSNWIDSLAELEQNGIGERTSEGFGQIKVCDEFHQVMRENPM